jgi:hypothetical protein
MAEVGSETASLKDVKLDAPGYFVSRRVADGAAGLHIALVRLLGCRTSRVGPGRSP